MKTSEPDIKNHFRQHFGSLPTHCVRAPGRLELLGNHTDYNQGLVMAVAVDQYLQMASAPRSDGQIELVSSAFDRREKFACDHIAKEPAAPWANYIKGVLLQLRKRHVNFTGFSAAIHSSIPVGAGLSSSAALEVATALTVRNQFPFELTPAGLAAPSQRSAREKEPELSKAQKLLLAGLCRNAESEFVGVNCGLLDQITCLFGKAGQVVAIDCQRLTVDHFPMPSGTALIVCDSGVKHDLADGAYNSLRQECESAARALGAATLRAVSHDQLEARKAQLSEREYQCALHIVGENRRVVAGEKALRDGEVETFGQFLFESHASSRDFFRNSCPELDLLVDLARSHSGCIGARLTGGGFGGATINLVRDPETDRFCQELSAKYHNATGRSLTPLRCRVVDGAS